MTAGDAHNPHPHPAGLVIRAAGPGDAGLILGFIRALATYERDPDAVEVNVEVLRQQLAAPLPPFECLIAEHEGRACGFALYFANYSTWRGRSGIYLEDLFVIPEARGQGIGRALLCDVARIAVGRGARRLEWAVLDWNQPAIDFYRSLGAEAMTEWTVYRLSDHALDVLAKAGG